MRIIASALALASIGIAAPAASACRIGPTPILVAVWDQAPTPEQLRPGEVALEVALPANADLIEPRDLDEIVTTTCNPDQVMLLQVIRVLAGDAHGAAFVIALGSMIMSLIQVDPATGKPVGPAPPERWFVVGTLHAQSRYVVATDSAAGTVGRALPALVTRSPQQ